MTRYAWAIETHVGLVRTKNEDSVTPATDGAGDGPLLIAVADGMGGHAAGDVASRIAIESIQAAGVDEAADPAERIRAANRAVIDAMTADPRLSGMGTTLTLGLFTSDGKVHIGHVGDSRAYLIRNDEVTQLTTDDTVVASLVAAGRLSPKQARNDPRRHLVTQSIGMSELNVETIDVDLETGDLLLFCSDGLTGMIDDDDIAVLIRERDSLSDAAWGLVTAANAAGGHDNTTVAVVEVHGS